MSEKQKTTEPKTEDLVSLSIPPSYDPATARTPVVIEVNFKEYRLERGKTHMVPPFVKEIYDDTLRRAHQSMQFVAETENTKY